MTIELSDEMKEKAKSKEHMSFGDLEPKECFVFATDHHNLEEPKDWYMKVSPDEGIMRYMNIGTGKVEVGQYNDTVIPITIKVSSVEYAKEGK